jgi:hypothetical protein
MMPLGLSSLGRCEGGVLANLRGPARERPGSASLRTFRHAVSEPGRRAGF